MLAHPDVLQLPWVPGEQGRGLGRSQPGSCHLHRPLSRSVQAQEATHGLDGSAIPLAHTHTYALRVKHGREEIYLLHVEPMQSQ